MLIEGDDSHNPVNVDLTNSIMSVCSLLGFKVKIDKYRSAEGGNSFCKFVVTTIDCPTTSKLISSSFYKHGLTTNRGIIRNSRHEAILV